RPLVVLLLSVLVPGLPAPNTGRGDAGQPLADGREGLLLALRDDEQALPKYHLRGQAPRDVQPVPAALRAQVLGGLCVAWACPRLVEPDSHVVVMAWELGRASCRERGGVGRAP